MEAAHTTVDKISAFMKAITSVPNIFRTLWGVGIFPLLESSADGENEG